MKKIVLIKYAAIGDVLRTTALLPAIKERYPDSPVIWVTESRSRPILEGNPFIEKILLECELTDRFKNEEYRLVINLDEDFDACQLAADLKAEDLAGYYLKDGRIVCSESAKGWMAMGLLGGSDRDLLKKANRETYQKIMFGIAGLEYNLGYRPAIFLSSREKDFALEFARRHNINPGKDYVVGVNTGAGKRWPLKKMSVEKTASLIDKLSQKDLKVILLGGQEELERNARIKKLLKGKVIDAGCANSLREFASLIGICDSLISSDTLAMHISISLGRHTLAFFGPTPEQEIEFYSNGEALSAPVKCACCMKKVICEESPNCMGLIDERFFVGKITQRAGGGKTVV